MKYRCSDLEVKVGRSGLSPMGYRDTTPSASSSALYTSLRSLDSLGINLILVLVLSGLSSACSGRRHGQGDNGESHYRSSANQELELCSLDQDCADEQYCHYTSQGSTTANESGSCRTACTRDENCDVGQSC